MQFNSPIAFNASSWATAAAREAAEQAGESVVIEPASPSVHAADVVAGMGERKDTH